jgi:hypothetical protein
MKLELRLMVCKSNKLQGDNIMIANTCAMCGAVRFFILLTTRVAEIYRIVSTDKLALLWIAV